MRWQSFLPIAAAVLLSFARADHLALAQVEPPPRDDSSEHQSVVWASGNVIDESGAPIGGAVVYALASYDRPLRTYEITEAAQTDSHGRYTLRLSRTGVTRPVNPCPRPQ
jgi:protocatechuate 3,4-dioxygenase beta subunit